MISLKAKIQYTIKELKKCIDLPNGKECWCMCCTIKKNEIMLLESLIRNKKK